MTDDPKKPIRRRARRQGRIAYDVAQILGNKATPPPPHGPEIDFYFVDDSVRTNCQRDGMKDGRKLIAMGGVGVGAEEVGPLTREIDALCKSAGFPKRAAFKWSPQRDARSRWMHESLRDGDRTKFYEDLFKLMVKAEASVLVMIEDEKSKPIRPGLTHQQSVVRMLLERISLESASEDSEAFVIADRSKSKATEEEAFLADCLDAIESDDFFVKYERIAHPVVSAPFAISRLLQVADVVTSCVNAYVSGGGYAAQIFPLIKPMLRTSDGVIGGVGVKIHADFRYRNLYHHLLGDSHYTEKGTKTTLPDIAFPYWQDGDSYSLKLKMPDGETISL